MVRPSGFLPVLGIVAALAPSPAAAEPGPYAVDVTGVEDDELRSLLEETSSLVRLKDQPPPGPVGLRRRADDDRRRLDTALRSEGYYDARIAVSLGAEAGDTRRVLVAVAPEEPYRFHTISLTPAAGTALPGGLPDAAALGLGAGSVARAPLVVAAEQRLKDALALKGFPFARVAGRRAVIDRDQHTMDVTYSLDPGPLVRLGEARFAGLDGVAPALAAGRIGWRPGDLYRPELIERTRAALSALGVFNAVTLEVDKTPAADGRHDVAVTVAERKRRFVGFGASYSNSAGLGGQAYWGHRNLFGGGEQLRFGAELDRLDSNSLTRIGLDHADEKVTAELRKPDFLSLDQTLILTASAINEHPEAYQRQAVTEQIRLERRFDRQLTVSAGLIGEQSTILDVVGETGANLTGLPLSLTYDTTGTLLEPTGGYRLALETTPWLRTDRSGSSFMVNRITGSSYYDLTGTGGLVTAGRFSFGTILAANAASLPTDKRLFGGGGGSIRGYGYQKVGPVNDRNIALGGRSLLELGAELRIRITEDFGLVPFVDAGNVYSGVLPVPRQSLRVGSGLGVRYYTPFGPLRLDVGVPVPKRRHDDPVQIYISLGQAF
ncbi:MAG: BamA/TamA family outer membrane protein [Rhodospirillaceae bacterium]